MNQKIGVILTAAAICSAATPLSAGGFGFGGGRGGPQQVNGFRPEDLPDGIAPLERDIFTTDDFYVDHDLWTDSRYFRCMSNAATEDQWVAVIGNSLILTDDPADGVWGHCDIDLPRDAIVSPYGFETAQEHYEALLEETRGRGGPDEYTFADFRMQSIEIYTPNRDDEGNFTGLNHESVLYDPEALVEPVRIVRNMNKINDYQDEDATPYTFIECVQTIFPIEGIGTPVSPGEVIEYRVPDMYGRPWAEISDRYFEQDMEKGEDEDIFSFQE